MWDSLVPAKIRSSSTHCASTEKPCVGGVVGSCRAEALAPISNPTIGTRKKKSYGFDLKKNEIGHILRGESLLREVIESGKKGKRPMGTKRLGILNEFLKEASYAELKIKTENRKYWRTWKPRTCQTVEN